MSVFAWGLGKNGQLGQGDRENRNNPVSISRGVHTPKESYASGSTSISTRTKGRNRPRENLLESIQSIGAGGIYTGTLSTNGRMFCCGSGAHGRLGTGDETDQLEPILIPLPENTKSISCGIWHGAAVTLDGKLYTWGYNKSHGVLGLSPDLKGSFSSPAHVNCLSAHHIVGVSCGNNYTLAWDNNGELFSWGNGKHGVLGHGDEKDKHEPTKVDYIRERIIFADAGFAHCGVVTAEGNIFMSGKGQCGALGLGPKNLKSTPRFIKINKPTDVIFKEISCGCGEHHGHTLALSVNGEVFVWGDGYKGKLGLGDQESRFLPELVPRVSFNGEEILHVSAGGIHSAAVSCAGHVYTWGCGSDGRLGHPEAKGHRYLFRSDVPRLVEELRNKGNALSVKASYYHTVALLHIDQ